MNQLRRLELSLQALTAILLLIAVLALLSRPSLHAVAVPPERLDAVAGPDAPFAGIDPAVTQAVIDANVFSPTRTAPEMRYSPFEPDPATVAAPMTDSVPSDSTMVSEDEGVPKLYGTIIGPGGAAALMRLDPAAPNAVLYREGQRGGAYRVIKVDEQSVVLRGPEGRIVLKLVRQEGHDRETKLP